MTKAVDELVKKLTDATEYGDVGPEGYETIWLPTALEIVRAALPEMKKQWLAEETKGRAIVPVKCPACDTGAVMFLDELLTTVSPELREAIQRKAFYAGHSEAKYHRTSVYDVDGAWELFQKGIPYVDS